MSGGATPTAFWSASTEGFQRIGITNQDVSSSVYYGNGVRRSHTVNGTTTTYITDLASRLPVVLQDGSKTYVYGLDLISATDSGGTQAYYSYDALGSVVNLTNGSGTVTDSYTYDVWGSTRSHTGSSSNEWQFTGEQSDRGAGDSAYYFLRARYYDPAIGRFISKDPIEFDQRYAYVSNNPALLIDPSGLCGEDHETTGGCGGYTPGASYGSSGGAKLTGSGKSAPSSRGSGVKLHEGQQGKHQLAHNNYIEGKSILSHPDPQRLLDDYAGTGRFVENRVPAGAPNSREIVDFKEVIGVVLRDGSYHPTTMGTIHYGKNGAHIVPFYR